MRRLLKFLGRHQAWVVAVGFVLAVGAMIVTVNLRDTPDPRIAAIRAKGYPTSLAELGTSYPAVPVEANAALVCMRAFALPSFPEEANATADLLRKDWRPPRGESLKPEALSELEALLEMAAPSRELLHSIPANAQARYPLDFTPGFATLLPHLRHFKPAMRLLEAEMLVHSANGEIGKAVDSVLAADRVRSTLDHEPVFVSKLVSLNSTDILMRDIEYLLSAHRLPPEALQLLTEVTAKSRVEGSLAEAIAADRVLGIAVFEDPAQIGQMGGPQPNAFSRGVLETLRVSGVFSRDRAFYLDTMSNYLFAAEQPFPLRWGLGKQISDTLAPKKYYIISRTLMPSLGGAFSRQTEAVARVRLAETALAIEGFRREHSERLPQSLQELAPKYLASIPTDPFDGNPVRYGGREDGFVVYCLGFDQIDNGGTPVAKQKKGVPSANAPSGDVCFIVGKAIEGATEPEPETTPLRGR